MSRLGIAMIAVSALMTSGASAVELPEAIAAPNDLAVMEVHAVGAQIYECKANAAGHLSWIFREPIASLIQDGRTIGRHYAGPTWTINNSTIVGKVVGHAPGAGAKDVPWLKLEVTDRSGAPPLIDVTTVQRINTIGGNLEGDCQSSGDLRAEPYSADYIFLKKVT
jgi:Protein of unknown function (DUF3455)